MIHNVSQPDFEQFVYEELLDDPNVEMHKGIGFVSCQQVSLLRVLYTWSDFKRMAIPLRVSFKSARRAQFFLYSLDM